MVDRVVLVRQQIPGQSGTVVEPAAPAEETLGREAGWVWRSGFVLGPVDGLRVGLRVDGVYPSTDRIVAVGCGFYQRNWAKNVLFTDLLGFHVSFVLTILMTELKDDASFADRRNNLVGFLLRSG